MARNGHYYALAEAQKQGKKSDHYETDSNIPIFSESAAQAPEAAVNTIIADREHDVLMRFRDVAFSYPSRPENKIFRGLNLTILKGETLALVGPSGHGKSTVIQLIERFYDPDRGVVEMHGTDLKDVNVAYLRDKVGLVSQEPTLFDASIADNIRYGKPDATQAESKKQRGGRTCTTQSWTFLKSMRHPSALAEFRYEATSALDTANEKVVQAALDEIMHSKAQTTVVIAHSARFQDEEHIDAGERFEELDKERVKKNAKRAWAMGAEDGGYFFVGAIGAFIAGLVFPGWGKTGVMLPMPAIRSQLTLCGLCKSLYVRRQAILPYATCQEYWNASADSMRDMSFKVAFGYIGTIAAAMIGNMLLFYGFNMASERMNKRVRDAAFASLVRQEVTYFDLHPVADLTSRLEDDAALLKAFCGEPIRTIVMNIASVVVGLIVSLIFMWPFALVTLCILPFLAFGAVMKMKMFMAEDVLTDYDDEHSSGAIVIETLTNIRTVASLSAEEERLQEFDAALSAEDPNSLCGNVITGSGYGLGRFVQMWGTALLFWWGGYLLVNYPDSFDFRDFLISMFSLLFSLSGLGIAAQGATDRDKAKLAAERIFELTDRESQIDPLSEEGKKDV
ncbi:ABC transporter [Fragilaria crotonensis]|nr:ABC transporter [Fragilaria crotonensis]